MIDVKEIFQIGCDCQENKYVNKSVRKQERTPGFSCKQHEVILREYLSCEVYGMQRQDHGPQTLSSFTLFPSYNLYHNGFTA